MPHAHDLMADAPPAGPRTPPTRLSRTRGGAVLLAVVALLLGAVGSVGLAGPARSAEWIVLCTSYDPCQAAGYPHSGYKESSSTSYWRQSTGHNCTNYVAY